MSAARKNKLLSLAGLIRFLLIFALALLLCGYLAFLYHVSRAAPPVNMPAADGIVVLTGDGNRLETAGQVFAAGSAERLFVSGIHKDVSADNIQTFLGVPETRLTCCVDLDYIAQDTVENARETASWVNALGYEHIILVTSDYHMPRAELEISAATGGIRITPYPVSSSRVSSGQSLPLWRDKSRLQILAKEYGKLLVTFASRMGDRPNFPPQPVPAPSDIMKKAQEAPTVTGPLPPKDAPDNSSPENISPENTFKE